MPTPAPQGSLFVSTYDMATHLKLVLEGLRRQTSRDFELFICDDGSGPETRAVVERFASEAPFSVKHVWQENQGFRKCRILNSALRQAQGRVCIFLDGDCVPDRYFIADHLREQEPGRYLAGRRAELGPRYSAWLTPERVAAGELDRPRLPFLTSVLRGDSQYLNRTVRVTAPPLRRALKLDRVVDLKGCNYSVARSDLVAINGFDEAYEGYGREDTDVEIRLQNLGLRIKSLKGLALQYHVWHERRGFTPVNETLLERARRERIVRCEKGLES